MLGRARAGRHRAAPRGPATAATVSTMRHCRRRSLVYRVAVAIGAPEADVVGELR